VLTNKILNRILAITRVIALVPGHIIGYVVASLTFIPFALSIYVSIMFLIWLPLAGLMLVTSWLWRKAPPMRLPVAVVGIPIVVITDTFYQVMVMPDPNDGPRDGEFCTSWPLLSETNRP
jgi:uncharacterized membrane protein